MAKKIYDILPPKVANKLVETIKNLEKGRKNKDSFGAPRKRVSHKASASPKKEKRFPLKEVLIGGLIIVVLLGIYVFTKLPKAHIFISPKVEVLTFEEKITANKLANRVDIMKKIIPARYLQEEQSASQEFNATGSASNNGKATGTITIYNKLNPVGPFTLIKGTHFLSNSGKYFIITQKAVIPAAKYQGGKLVAGSVSAAVEAKEAGEGYNIGSSQFSIPKLSGTNYYYSISAESTGPMKGGYVGTVKKVTKDDINKAKESLTQKLLSDSEGALRGKLSEGDILLDDAMAKTVISFKSSVSEGAISEKFSAEARVKISALVFKREDLEIFAKGAIASKLAKDKNYLPESLQLDYRVEVIDINAALATINVKVSVKPHKSINVNSLVNLVSMESASQINQTVNQIYGDAILGTKIDFWPFWVKTAPKDKDRIHIDLKFE